MIFNKRHYRRTLLLIVVLALTVSVALAQDNDDAFEPQFPQMIDSTVITATFDDEVNAQLYAFQGSDGDWISIEMIQRPDDSALDPYLVLLGPDGAVLTSDDDSSEVLLAAHIERHQVPEDGTYMVLATSARGLRFGADAEMLDDDDTLTYDIVMRGASLPLTDEPLAVFFEPFAVGESSAVTIDLRQPVALFRFDAESGQTVTLTTSAAAGEPDVDTLLYLFDAEGRRLAVNDDADFESGNYYASIEDFEIPEDGTYLVMATSFDFDLAHLIGWDSGGSFVLSIEESQ